MPTKEGSEWILLDAKREWQNKTFSVALKKVQFLCPTYMSRCIDSLRGRLQNHLNPIRSTAGFAEPVRALESQVQVARVPVQRGGDSGRGAAVGGSFCEKKNFFWFLWLGIDEGLQTMVSFMAGVFSGLIGQAKPELGNLFWDDKTLR